MKSRNLPTALRWLFCAVGVGASIAAGIYLHVAVDDGFHVWKAARAGMFFMIGLFSVLMYGENR